MTTSTFTLAPTMTTPITTSFPAINTTPMRHITTKTFNLTSVKPQFSTFTTTTHTTAANVSTPGHHDVLNYLQQRQLSTAADHSDDDHDHGAYEKKEAKNPEDVVMINIIDRSQKQHTIKCKVGDNVLELMRLHTERTDENIWLEGSCEKSLACSTCHIILDDKTYNLLQNIKEATEEEEDMLDMAACLTPTSRLGCQINLTKEMDGATITLPKFSRNMYIDGHIPQPH